MGLFVQKSAIKGSYRVHQSRDCGCAAVILLMSSLRTMCEQSLRLCEYRLPEDTHIEIQIPKHF